MNVCVPIPASTVKEGNDLAIIAKEKHADLLEFRLDYLENDFNISKLIYSIELPKIATNRISTERGKFKGTENERLQILIKAAEAGCEFVDIEIATTKVKEIVEKIKSYGAKVIISYHDFQSTPKISELERILDKQKNLGADICKIVLTARNIEDNLGILKFLSNNSGRTNIVSFAMGKYGVISRILSPIYGACFTFASIDRGLESAEGQLTIEEMREIYRTMRLE